MCHNKNEFPIQTNGTSAPRSNHRLRSTKKCPEFASFKTQTAYLKPSCEQKTSEVLVPPKQSHRSENEGEAFFPLQSPTRLPSTGLDGSRCGYLSPHPGLPLRASPYHLTVLWGCSTALSQRRDDRRPSQTTRPSEAWYLTLLTL